MNLEVNGDNEEIEGEISSDDSDFKEEKFHLPKERSRQNKVVPSRFTQSLVVMS